MKIEELQKQVLMKQEIHSALEVFKKRYSKTSKGIENIHNEIMLSNNLDKIEKLYGKFFGYIQKSKNAKEKWEEE